MTTVLNFTRESNIGFKSRRLRVSSLITKQELADAADVSLDDIDLFEHNLPLALDIRRRILRGLWSVNRERQPA